MSPLQAPLFSATGEGQGTIDLPPAIFGVSGSRRVLQETVRALQANQRCGTSSTKTRAMVRGGGHKPWKQKGTGNARAGSIRSPLWRKGGIIFGPHPRSYRIDLGRVKREIALQTALAEKARASEIRVLDSLTISEPKTREAEQWLRKIEASGRILLVVDKKEEKVVRAFNNIEGIRLAEAAELNAWHLMAARRVLVTKAALEALERRLPKGEA
jgi:large subunit ribosomal protein L4